MTRQGKLPRHLHELPVTSHPILRAAYNDHHADSSDYTRGLVQDADQGVAATFETYTAFGHDGLTPTLNR
jgi:hypothetical protein